MNQFDLHDELVFNTWNCSDQVFDQMIKERRDIFDMSGVMEGLIAWAEEYDAIPGYVTAGTGLGQDKWPAIKFASVDDKLIFLLKL